MVTIDFNKTLGKIKPMNGVNNGPAVPSVRGTSNFDLYKAANIPFARLHDSAFSTFYGWEFTVDVHRIFRNFDADVNDPASYDFEETDKYIKTITDAGTEVFYRLGCNIEHGKKFGTFPPKDFRKWAQICEHIIMHFNEGWANGFNYGIRYWEIWNEPDCGNPDGSNPCWQGTPEQFGEFFSVAAKYLKNRFPNLKIGGPAFAWMGWKKERSEVVLRILEIMRKNDVKLDFVSYHCYARTPEDLCTVIDTANEIYAEYGYSDCEKVLNEWSYVRGWVGEDWIYTCEAEQGKKGAAFYTAVMNEAQKKDVDMLMYYDARPNTVMNGMFDQFLRARPGYYSIAAFGELRTLGDCVCSVGEDNVYVCAAKGNGGKEAVVSYFNNDDSAAPKSVDFEIKGADGKAEIYVLGDKGFELKEVVNAGKFAVKMDLFDIVKVVIK